MKKCIIFLFTVCLTFKSVAQSFLINNYAFNTYTTTNGLTDNVIVKTIKDKYGFLWIATHNGISRFDGLYFKTYTHDPADSTSLRSIWVTDLLIDKNQTLWASTEWGVCYYNSYTDKFVYINNRADIQPIYKAPLCLDSSGFIWVAAQNGLKKIDPISKKYYSTALQNIGDPWFIVNSTNGIFYIGTRGKGLIKYNSKLNTFKYVELPLVDKESHLMGAYVDVDGIWIAASEGLVLLDKNEKFTLFAKAKINENNITVDQLMCIQPFDIETQGQQLICGTYNKKLFVFDKILKKFTYQFQPVTNENVGFYPALVYTLYADNNTYWIGTDRGLKQLSINNEQQTFLISNANTNTSLFKKVIPYKNEKNNLVCAITCQPFNSLLIFDPNSKKTIEQWQVKGNGREGKYVDILYSTIHNNIVALRDNAIDFYTLKKGLVKTIQYSGDASCFMEDEAGNFWVGTFNGLLHIETNTKKVTEYNCNFLGTEEERNTFGANFPITSIKKSNHLLWISCIKYGLFSFDVGTKKFTAHRQLFTDTYSCLNRCTSIQLTNDDSIWVGNTAGLTCFIPSQNKFINYDATSNLKSTYVYALAKDANNNIIGRGNADVFYVNTKTQKIISINVNPQYSVFSYDQTLSSNGNDIYLGHEGGYTKFNVGIFKHGNVDKPSIQFTNFEESNNKISFNKDSTSINPLMLRYYQNNIVISYTSIEYYHPEDVEYWYCLKGLEKEWIQAGNKKSINYSNLPPGKYNFEVYAVNKFNDKVSNTNSFLFYIQPAIWQRWWFWPLLAICFIMGVLFFARKRVIAIKQREKQQTAVNKTMAELETKMLRSQMNPHFIFNSLNSIQKYIWENKEEDAAEYLANFAKLMRAILENSRKEFIPVKEEITVMKLYIELEHRRSNANFNYIIKIDDELINVPVKIPPLILQPFIENAIWHGLNKKNTKGNLGIYISKNESNLICVIDDDGVGRSFKKTEQKENKSLGIEITKQRIEKLMKTTGQQATVQIEDKMKNDVADGTTVTITLPLQI